MRFGLGLSVRLFDAVAFKGELIAGVGVCEDGRNPANGGFGQMIDCYGAAHTFVADMEGDNPV